MIVANNFIIWGPTIWLILFRQVFLVLSEEIFAFDFSPLSSGNFAIDDIQSKNNNLIIQPNHVKNPPSGYTLCLRLKFRTWQEQVIFSSPSLTLEFHRSAMLLKHGNGFYWFDWKGHMTVSYHAWNSICIIHNSLNLTLEVRIKKNSTLSVVNVTAVGEVSGYPLILNPEHDRPIIGQVTDVNFWSRPLSLEESNEFTVNCNLSSSEKLMPDYIREHS